ncbi:ABC transporter permease [Malaciobacter marinus]|uniref:Molybdate/sulfate/tungstate ABC transporter, permease protein n=1 Tax=Malaciobacter marinus TaxID=505249 RepID=A0A347TM67_9BACT|nr:ABC transporter permease [Malaciobacter marinus]AXX87695.1 molybdate/sulfate/tungstate ABC transporter, permease protein [Malaciobacter marinus]PHO12325.1 molybdenum ABC transporter permease [Malaciobacter marinus]PHO15335.1 molybdenum ABC transporter permease [Malaciobacter marinus]
MQKKSFTVLLITLAFIIVFFLSVPILKMFVGVGSDKLIETIKDGEVLASIWLTMKVSAWAMMFVLITGLPLAYIIARYNFPGRSLIESIIDIPVMIPHTAAGIALLTTFGDTFLGDFFKFFGIEFVGTEYGIMIAMMFLSAPFLINSAKDGFRKVDVKLEKVARTLGASPISVFFRITIPNAKKDIINGALMMWSRGLGEFGAVVILVYHPMTTPVLIFDRFNSYGLSFSAPVAAVIIGFSVLVFLAVRFATSRLK